MKYCPFCGAVLPDEKISFCLECGENLTALNQHTETEKPAKKPKKEKKKEKKTKCKKKREPDAELFSEEPTETVSDNYDGYYADNGRAYESRYYSRAFRSFCYCCTGS